MTRTPYTIPCKRSILPPELFHCSRAVPKFRRRRWAFLFKTLYYGEQSVQHVVYRSRNWGRTPYVCRTSLSRAVGAISVALLCPSVPRKHVRNPYMLCMRSLSLLCKRLPPAALREWVCDILAPAQRVIRILLRGTW
jgi:hypothetical protein